MDKLEILQYVSYAYSFLVGIIAFSGSDWLWKRRFFNKCLFAAVPSGIAGLIFEFSGLFKTETGLTIVVMFIPLIYLGYFQLFRWIFKKWKGTEPVITVHTVIGAIPNEYESALRNGEERKYSEGRKVTAADFLFSFAQALIPIFTIFILLFYVFEIQKK